jgi:hypothetical protein
VEKVDHPCCGFCRRKFSKIEPQQGRPRVYCDDACRRAAEMEIRRTNDRLAELERRVSESRMGPIQSFDDPAALEVEIGRQCSRLLELLEPNEVKA